MGTGNSNAASHVLLKSPRFAAFYYKKTVGLNSVKSRSSVWLALPARVTPPNAAAAPTMAYKPGMIQLGINMSSIAKSKKDWLSGVRLINNAKFSYIEMVAGR